MNELSTTTSVTAVKNAECTESKTSASDKDEYSKQDYNYKELGINDLNKLMENENVSKNQKKKIRKQIKWLSSVDERREQRKRKKQLYKEKLIATGQVVKRPKLEKVTTCEDFDKLIHVAIDCNYDHLMSNKDLKKLGKQIAWCYKENRRSKHPVQYHVCELGARLALTMDPSYINWDLHFDKKLFETFSKDKITYLTAESTNVLSTLKPGMVYVIGGLVDHNHHKGLCHEIAEDNGVATARLPLEENIDIKTRKVLTVNHVFEILLAFRETGDWKEAILKILPAKKLEIPGGHCAPEEKSVEQTSAEP